MTKPPFSEDRPPQACFILLSCHSLEDFPTHLTGEDAAAMLLGWSVIWHPQLIVWTGKMPQWQRADEPPADLGGCLVVVPRPSDASMPIGTVERANAAEGCLLVRVGDQSRQEIEAATQLQPSDSPRVADFYALGYAYLQVQLMTRQLRYSSNLDEEYFEQQVVAAAVAWRRGDDAATEEALHNCFDLLAQERDHSFSADPYLVDLTLVAETTLGEELTRTLQADQPANLLLSVEMLEKLQQQNPEAFASLRSKAADGRIGICGGMIDDATSLDTMSLSAAIMMLADARNRYIELIGKQPDAFGRFAGGLPADLPVLIAGLGYAGAIYADFANGVDGGQDEAKLMWQAGDAEIAAICSTPLDASRADVFLGLGPRLGEAVDAGQVATALLVHWPGHECFAYEDLQRACRWGLTLGKFQSLPEYFVESERPYHSFEPSSSIAGSDPVDSIVRGNGNNALSELAEVTANNALAEMVATQAAMTSLLTGRRPSSEATDATLEKSGSQLAEALGFTLASDPHAASEMLVLNTNSAAARMHVQVPGHAPAKGGHIYAGHATENGSVAVVDTPGYGFSTVAPAARAPKSGWLRAAKPLASDEGLRNDFIEMTIHPGTGGVLSVHTVNSRNNRMSMQLVYRDPVTTPEKDASMKLSSLKVIRSDKTCGAVRCEGQIVTEDGREVAACSVTYRIELGSRILLVDVDLQPRVELSNDAWQNYFAARIAWSMEASVPKRILRDQIRASHERKMLAPQGIFIDEAGPNTLVLANGLPAHRCIGRRMLDTLLIVRGESRRTFQLAYGFDTKNPVATARQHLTPPQVYGCTGSRPVSTGWLFHIDSPTVVASDWQADVSGERPKATLRLCETIGKKSRVRLRSFKDIASARVVDSLGSNIRDLEPKGDCVEMNLSGHQVLMIELTFVS